MTESKQLSISFDKIDEEKLKILEQVCDKWMEDNKERIKSIEDFRLMKRMIIQTAKQDLLEGKDILDRYGKEKEDGIEKEEDTEISSYQSLKDKGQSKIEIFTNLFKSMKFVLIDEPEEMRNEMIENMKKEAKKNREIKQQKELEERNAKSRKHRALWFDRQNKLYEKDYFPNLVKITPVFAKPEYDKLNEFSKTTVDKAIVAETREKSDGKEDSDFFKMSLEEKQANFSELLYLSRIKSCIETSQEVIVDKLFQTRFNCHRGVVKCDIPEDTVLSKVIHKDATEKDLEVLKLKEISFYVSFFEALGYNHLDKFVLSVNNFYCSKKHEIPAVLLMERQPMQKGNKMKSIKPMRCVIKLVEKDEYIKKIVTDCMLELVKIPNRRQSSLLINLHCPFCKTSKKELFFSPVTCHQVFSIFDLFKYFTFYTVFDSSFIFEEAIIPNPKYKLISFKNVIRDHLG